MSQRKKTGELIPKIKISENRGKITNPHFKKLYRIISKETGQPIADLMCVHDEVIDESEPLNLFDPIDIWKNKTVTDYVARELLVPIFKSGERVYECPDLKAIQDYCKNEVEHLWDEVKRFENPHRYYVDLSQKLWDIKNSLLLNKGRKQGQ